MADNLDPDVTSQASTYQDDDDSFSADSDFTDTEPIKGRKSDKGKKKEPKYKTFEEEDSTSIDGTPDKAKITKRGSFFKIGLKPKIKEKDKDKEKQKEKQKPKSKDKNKEKERSSREQEKAKSTKSKDRGRSWSKSKEAKDRDKLKKQSTLSGVDSEPAELKPVFGVDLALAVERSNPHDGIQLPLIVRDCIDYIEANGMCVEGIYRLSGVKSRIDALRTAYDTSGEDVDLTDQDPHVVAGLLKLFLRELPEPVLPQNIMLALEDSSKIPDSKTKIQMFRGAINELPVCNRTLLSWVIVHMAHVIGNEIETKMNLQNISIVLCPTLHISHRVLNIFFSFWRDIFGDVVLKKVKRRLRWRFSRTSIELPDSSFILEEELKKQESILNEMHDRMNKGTADKKTEEQLWEIQRIVTQLKRKIRVCRKSSETAIAPVLKEETPAVEVKSEDGKVDDSVFIETVPEVNEKPVEETPEKTEKQDEPENEKVETKVEEPIRDVENNEGLKENKEESKENKDEVEKITNKKQETEEVVVVEKPLVVEKEIPEEHEKEKIIETGVSTEIEKGEIVNEDVENEVIIEEKEEETVEEKEDEKKIIEETKDDSQLVKEYAEEKCKEEEDDDDEEIIKMLLITQAEALARQEELKKIQSELQKRIEAERNDIERLRQKLAEEERIESLQLRASSFEESDSSNSSNSSSESEDEDMLMEILTKLTKENEKLESKNNELVMNIISERERCVDLRVKMTTMILKEDLEKRRSFSGPAPLETDL